MVLIPPADETLLRIYLCPRCEIMFRAQVGNMRRGCLSSHSPGSCCHYAEQSVSAVEMGQVRKVLGGVWDGHR